MAHSGLPPWLLRATVPLVANPEMASAATAFTANAVPSALAAYGHYLSVMVMVGLVMAERLLIKPNMSQKDEDVLSAVDSAYGITGLLTLYTGYLRLTEYEKGLDFYLHEPIFWVKIAFLGVFGASSFFNTTIIILRVLSRRSGDWEPLGEKLVARMHQICNAELTALAFIPLTATLMARGVLYTEDIPWQVEAFLSLVCILEDCHSNTSRRHWSSRMIFQAMQTHENRKSAPATS